LLLRTSHLTTTITDDAGAGGGGAGGGAGAGAGAGDGGGDAGGAGAAAAAPYYEAFNDPTLKASPSVQIFKTPEDLARGYVNLEKRFGIDPARRIDLPADPNDKDGMRAVYAKLGLPEKPDGYGLKLDDKASDADKATLASFAAKAHELGLPNGMAQGILQWVAEQTTAAETAQTEALTARESAGKADLTKEFGTAYEPRMREINALVTKYGDPELVTALAGDNLVSFPGVAKMLGKILDRMAEPGTAGGQGGDGDKGEARALTPNQARAAVAALEGDPVKGAALRDRNHAQHRAVVDERNRLLQMTGPA
jgi:hypothetical protein